MPGKFTAQGVAPECWNVAVASMGSGGLFQTTLWALLRNQLRGSKALYLTVEANGKTKARCLVMKEGMYGERLPGLRSLQSVANRLLPSFNCFHGPVLAREGSRADVQMLVDGVEHLADEAGVVSISFTPHPLVSVELLEPILTASGYASRSLATLIVDLSEDFEKSMHRSVAKNARKCRRNGIAVEIVGDHELISYYHLIDNFRKEAGLRRFSLDDYMIHREVFKERRVLFGARFEGQFIAALGVHAFNGLLIECEAATGRACFERNLFANDLLKLEIMRWGRERGFQFFDLAGVAVEPKNKKEEGIKRYKSKFGGKYVPYIAFERIRSGPMKSLVPWLRRRARYVTSKSAGSA